MLLKATLIANPPDHKLVIQLELYQLQFCMFHLDTSNPIGVRFPKQQLHSKLNLANICGLFNNITKIPAI